MGIRKLRGTRRVKEIAGQRQLEAAGDGKTVNRADDRFGAICECCDQGCLVAEIFRIQYTATFAELLEIDTRGKGLALSRQHYDAHILVDGQAGEGIYDCSRHRA